MVHKNLMRFMDAGYSVAEVLEYLVGEPRMVYPPERVPMELPDTFLEYLTITGLYGSWAERFNAPFNSTAKNVEINAIVKEEVDNFNGIYDAGFSINILVPNNGRLPELEVKDGEVMVVKEKQVDQSYAFRFHCLNTTHFDKCRDFSTEEILQHLEELYQEHRKDSLVAAAMLGLVPQRNRIPNEKQWEKIQFWYGISQTGYTTTMGEYQDREIEYKFTRYFSRILKITDDAFLSDIDLACKAVVDYSLNAGTQIVYLNNEELVDFYADPFGISSCMTGKDKGYCIDSYRLNPNCGLAVFKRNGQVGARSLIYITDAGVKGHCNVYSNGRVDKFEARDLLRDEGFVDLRTFYGMFDDCWGREHVSERTYKDIYDVMGYGLQDWVRTAPLPEECLAEIEDIFQRTREKVEDGEDGELCPDLKEWAYKWFALTFVTNEDWNIPFFDCFGMWRMEKQAKNLKLTALPFRCDLGDSSFKDLRKPAGAGLLYRGEGKASRYEYRLFDTLDEVKEKGNPYPGYQKGSTRGYLQCHHSGKWFRKDMFAHIMVYVSETLMVPVLEEYKDLYFRVNLVLPGEARPKSMYSYQLAYIEALDETVKIESLNQYEYDPDLTEKHPKTGLTIVTDPAARKQEVDEGQEFNNNLKGLADHVEFGSLKELRAKK